MNVIFLLVEFMDELVFGAGGTAWPLIRDELRLSYTQIGLLLSLPGLIAAFVEPLIGILGDVWRRRFLIICGGVFFTLSLALTSVSTSFLLLLISFVTIQPSSGAFVSLSQASLMDADPRRHEQNMARWTFAGSAGVLAGPLLLGGCAYFGLGWRGMYAFLAACSTITLVLVHRFLAHDGISIFHPPSLKDITGGFRNTIRTLQQRTIWRWLILLDFADLMMDVLFSYLALYLVDVARATEQQAGIGLTIWLAAGFVTDFIFIPIIDRQPDSMQYIRRSAILEILAFSLFVALPGFTPKLAALVLVNILNTGWYPILQGRLYSSLPGQSASIMAINSLTAPLRMVFPLVLGFLSDRIGLNHAIWILLLGPAALVIGIPRRRLTQTQ